MVRELRAIWTEDGHPERLVRAVVGVAVGGLRQHEEGGGYGSPRAERQGTHGLHPPRNNGYGRTEDGDWLKIFN